MQCFLVINFTSNVFLLSISYLYQNIEILTPSPFYLIFTAGFPLFNGKRYIRLYRYATLPPPQSTLQCKDKGFPCNFDVVPYHVQY